MAMERETGLEPATSSLGIFTSIEYKGYGAHGEHTGPANSLSLFKSLLIGVEMEWKNRLESLAKEAIIRSETRRLGARFRLRFSMRI
jgi:hypothetical protein